MKVRVKNIQIVKEAKMEEAGERSPGEAEARILKEVERKHVIGGKVKMVGSMRVAEDARTVAKETRIRNVGIIKSLRRAKIVKPMRKLEIRKDARTVKARQHTERVRVGKVVKKVGMEKAVAKVGIVKFILTASLQRGVRKYRADGVEKLIMGRDT